jgi:hypothetical protein
MKKLVLLLILMQSVMTIAQAPQKMSYQAVIRNSGGALVVNQAVGMKISVLQGSTSGTAVFAETHTPTTNANGLVSLEIGTGSPVNGTLAGVNWANGPYYIQSQIDVTGGTNYTLTGAYQLLSVPYALYAVNGVPKGNNTGDLLSWNGTQWEAIANTAATTNIGLPKVTTGSVDSNYCYSSTIVSDEGYSITAKGVCWSLSPNPTIADITTTDGQGMGTYTSLFHDLLPGRIYYVRAYATNSRGTGYGMSYTTSSYSALSIKTTAVTAITNNFAASGGTLVNDAVVFSTRGVVWGTSPNPTKLNNAGMATNGSGAGTFTISLSGLTPNTLYYVRAFGDTNNGSTGYGNQVTFTTSSMPYITTTAASGITTNSASSGGTLTNPSGNAILARGVVWGTSQNPTVALATKTMDGTTEGNFTSSITGLNLGTTYFVRAYVTNALGTSYGNTITVRPAALPTITTTAVTSIDYKSATCGGESITNGGSVILEKGIVWDTNPNPTTALATKTSDGNSSNSYSSSMTNLTYNTTYYVRAYARNQIGTAYGQELVFTTRTLQIGDNYQGGTIAYILREADPGYVAGEIHGLIRSINSQTRSWGCIGDYMGTTSTDFGTGESNTIEIVNNCTGDTAAKYCYDLVENGYDDWFLPSLNELSKFPVGIFNHQKFWTSSEMSSVNSYLVGEDGYYTYPWQWAWQTASNGNYYYNYIQIPTWNWNGYVNQFESFKGSTQPFYPVRRF